MMGTYWLITCGLLLFVAFSDAEKTLWREPEFGTVAHPKHQEVSSLVRRGDVFTDGKRLFRAKVSGHISDWVDGYRFPSDGETTNKAWEIITRGSYVYPFDLEEVRALQTGSIYVSKEGVYYKATCSAVEKKSCLHEIREKADWMTLLRPEIGDKPLGEVVLPATHDSGTWGIDENSYLVDKNFLFQIGELVTPETLANWSLTQDSHFMDQLEAGFREYDLRIADMETLNDTFRWWHGTTGDPIFEGLDQIAEFANTHPEEILFLQFGHFASPGNSLSPTLPIREERKDEIADIILEKLGDKMTYQSLLSDNPTMNEVLETGANIICIMNDAYIRGKDDRFWTNVITSSWSGRANSEDLFEERSGKLMDHRQNHANKITSISGCTTPNEKSVTAGLFRAYGDVDWIWDIIEIIAPGLMEVDPDRMSFEGMFVDLLYTAREGTNNDGMHVRLPEFYTNGASVNFLGTNSMMPYWLARPSLYKVNIMNTDDFASSTLVDTAILANRGEILREVTVAYQGSTRDGFYEWDGFAAVGGDEGHNCTAVLARFQVTSNTYQLPEEFNDLEDKSQVTFQEGEYPEDAVFTLEVSTPESEWHQLTTRNIQVMITSNMDLYLRSGAFDEHSGFAYVSLDYDSHTDECEVVPDSGYVDLVTW